MVHTTTTVLLAVSTCLTVMVLCGTAASEEAAHVRVILKALAGHAGDP